MSGCFCQKMAVNGPGMGKNRQNALSGPLHGMIPPKIAFFNPKISFLTQKKYLLNTWYPLKSSLNKLKAVKGKIT